MSLVNCPFCGQTVSDKAQRCPKCKNDLVNLTTCPKCHSKVLQEQPTCPKCGFSFVKICPECGSRIRWDSKSCPECGYFEEIRHEKDNQENSNRVNRVQPDIKHNQRKPDYFRNNLFFDPPSPKAGFIAMVGGALLILWGLALLSSSTVLPSIILMVFGVFIILFGIYLVKDSYNNIVTAKEYDDSVFMILGDFKERGLDKLGIDEDEVQEIEPIFFGEYDYENATKIKRGEDGRWRTDRFKAVIMFFSQDSVHVYTYCFSTIVNLHSEATDVYFYRDVVTVSTVSKNVNVRGVILNIEFFNLTTSGGTSLSVSLRDINNAQRSINAMRSLLKIKKQQGY